MVDSPIRKDELLKLKGRFHAHITMAVDNVPVWKEWAKFRNAKATVIMLEGRKELQTDAMLTKYFFIGDDSSKTVYDFIDQLECIAAEAESDGYKVSRIKVEHESLPTLRPSGPVYWECHFKVSIFGTSLAKLKLDVSEFSKSLVASSNPYDVSPHGHAIQFFNLRIYNSSKKDAMFKINFLKEGLKTILYDNNGLFIEEKIECVIYDTNHKHDSWWA